MHILHFLLNDPYWISVQGIIQNSSGLLMVWGALMMWHHSCDAYLWCWRPGKHRVTGTSWSTCSNHKTTEIHQALFHRHEDKHPDR